MRAIVWLVKYTSGGMPDLCKSVNYVKGATLGRPMAQIPKRKDLYLMLTTVLICMAGELLLPSSAVCGCLSAVGLMSCLLLLKNVSCLTFKERKKSSDASWLLPIVGVIFFSVSLFLSGSRAAFFSLLVGMISYVFLHAKRRYCLAFGLFFSIALIAALFALSALSPESVLGRLLIWRVCMGMIAEKPILGYGLCGFGRNYMYRQAEWLSTNPDSRYAELADDVFCPYNEILHVGVDFGIVGIILLCSVFLIILAGGIKTKNPVTAILVSLLTFSLFSFPSYVPQLCLFYAISCWLIVRNGTGVLCGALKIVSMVSCVAFFFLFVGRCCAYKELREMSDAELFPQRVYGLFSNDVILSDLCFNVAESRGIEIPIGILESMALKMPSCGLFCKIAEKHIAEGNYVKAEEYLRWATKMVPSRLEPHRIMFELLLLQNRMPEAEAEGRLILSKPVKIEGAKAIIVKNEIKKRMLENNMPIDADS